MRIQQIAICLVSVICIGIGAGLGAGALYSHITEQEETHAAIERSRIPEASVVINDGADLEISTFAGGNPTHATIKAGKGYAIVETTY